MIRHGDVHKIQTMKDFRRELGVTWDEITAALPAETCSEIIACENDVRENTNEDQIQDASEAHEDVLKEFLSQANEHSIIPDVLENRDREYIHLYDGYVHTIVDLVPLDWDDPYTGTYSDREDIPDEVTADEDYVVIPEQDADNVSVHKREHL